MLRPEALRVFVTVADCGNIRDAAARLYRTQSAVSMTLKQVEDHLGAPLFQSDRKHSLTDLGSFVLGVARVMLRDQDQALEMISDYAAGISGRLRIASVPSVATRLLPDILSRFLAARPMAVVDLVDTDSPEVRRLVATGQAELGIASADTGDGLMAQTLFDDALMLVCPTGSALAAATGPLDWQDLSGSAMILNETTRGIQAPGFQAIAARAQMQVRNVASLLAMVRAGVGVTLLPGLATHDLPQGLVARALRDETCRRRVCQIGRAHV